MQQPAGTNGVIVPNMAVVELPFTEHLQWQDEYQKLAGQPQRLVSERYGDSIR